MQKIAPIVEVCGEFLPANPTSTTTSILSKITDDNYEYVLYMLNMVASENLPFVDCVKLVVALDLGMMFV